MPRLDPHRLPRHVAIIPDGNGRWAEARGLPRLEGHRQGTENVRAIVRAAHELGVRELTLYAFSTENWARPEVEVSGLMDLLRGYIVAEVEELDRNGIRLETIGRRHELPEVVLRELDAAMRRTEGNDEMRLTFALSYSGRTELVDAAQRLARDVEAGLLEPDAIDEKCLQSYLYAPDLPDPDLLIRTGEERRVSNFLTWQIAYTELFFSERLWPDFRKSDLVEAIAAYQRRQRRFGRTSAQVQTRP
jgi:undecaprenyl diphosphate synthase